MSRRRLPPNALILPLSCWRLAPNGLSLPLSSRPIPPEGERVDATKRGDAVLLHIILRQTLGRQASKVLRVADEFLF
jgi:hypothetical protein